MNLPKPSTPPSLELPHALTAARTFALQLPIVPVPTFVIGSRSLRKAPLPVQSLHFRKLSIPLLGEDERC